MAGPTARPRVDIMSTLTVDEKEAIIEAMKALKKSSRNATQEVHGWRLQYKLRASKGGPVRGDMSAIDPSDGQELFSIISMERKLGLVEPAVVPPMAPPALDDGGRTEQQQKRGFFEDPVIVEGEGRSRRQRTVVNYAEMGTLTNRTRDLVLKAIEPFDRTSASGVSASADAKSGADLVDIVDGVHALSDDAFEILRPYAKLQATVANMLRQGLLRRRLVAAPSFAHGPTSRLRAGSSSSAAATRVPSVKDTLSMLVLSTLQVEPEDASTARWRLPSEAEQKAEAESQAEERGRPEGQEQGTAKDVSATDAIKAEGGSGATGGVGAESSVHAAASVAATEPGVRVKLAGCFPSIVEAEREQEPAEFVEELLLDEEDDDDEEDEDEDGGEGRSGRYVQRKRKGYRDDPYVFQEDSDDEDYAADSKRRGGGKAQRRGGGGSSAGGAGARAGEDALAAARPKVERLLSLNHVKERLPINVDPSTFGCPLGWQEAFIDEGKRRPKKKWVRLARSDEGTVQLGERGTELHTAEDVMAGGVDDDGVGAAAAAAANEIERRVDLEALLEREAEQANVPYLGNFSRATGEWQISAKALPAALTHVMDSLVAAGLARKVPSAECGRTQPHWVVANTYVRGEPFPKPSRPESSGAKKAEEEEEEPDELADIELERLRNIERNKEILRSLGLA